MNELPLTPTRGKFEVIPAEPMPTPSVGQLLQIAIDKGVSANELEKLVGLYERMENRAAERQFIEAYVRMQADMKSVRATKAVPNKTGGVKYRIAPYEEIDDQARPVYQKHGFAVSFSEGLAPSPDRITVICHLSHLGGHTRTNPYTVRIGSGPPDATQSQADMSAHHYARRGAFCDALHIVIDHAEQDDAKLEGAPITPGQAKELEKRVMDTASDREAFLKFAGADDFSTILSARYALLDASLRRKEKIV